MPRKTGIYAIRNARTGERYVGRAIDVVHRWAVHRRDLDAGVAHSPKLQQAWTECGQAAFVFEILEECAADELDDREDAHMREGCAYNHVQPMPALIVELPEQFAEQIAQLSPEQLQQLSDELDAEERTEQATEDAENASLAGIEDFSSALLSRAAGEQCTPGEIEQAMRYIEGGHPRVAYGVARVLSGSGQHAEAERILLSACRVEEAEASRQGHGVGAALYDRLAVMYRKSKRIDDEIAILERFAAQRHAPGVGPSKLLSRLEKIRSKHRS
jgi:hypothetical protein